MLASLQFDHEKALPANSFSYQYKNLPNGYCTKTLTCYLFSVIRFKLVFCVFSGPPFHVRRLPLSLSLWQPPSFAGDFSSNHPRPFTSSSDSPTFVCKPTTLLHPPPPHTTTRPPPTSRYFKPCESWFLQYYCSDLLNWRSSSCCMMLTDLKGHSGWSDPPPLHTEPGSWCIYCRFFVIIYNTLGGWDL